MEFPGRPLRTPITTTIGRPAMACRQHSGSIRGRPSDRITQCLSVTVDVAVGIRTSLVGSGIRTMLADASASRIDADGLRRVDPRMSEKVAEVAKHMYRSVGLPLLGMAGGFNLLRRMR